MFLHVSVILFTGGVCHTPPGRPPGQTPPPRQTPHRRPLPWADTPRADPPRADPPRADPLGRHPLADPSPDRHPPSACWDTVNKRVVRILLECNLVICFCLKEEARRIAAEEEKERLEREKAEAEKKERLLLEVSPIEIVQLCNNWWYLFGIVGGLKLDSLY